MPYDDFLRLIKNHIYMRLDWTPHMDAWFEKQFTKSEKRQKQMAALREILWEWKGEPVTTIKL